nr:MAG TPA: hypothetical protein [Caudoviricetes sp.]
MYCLIKSTYLSAIYVSSKSLYVFLSSSSY